MPLFSRPARSRVERSFHCAPCLRRGSTRVGDTSHIDESAAIRSSGGWHCRLHGRDLIGLIIHADAAQAEADMLRPRVDDMQRLLAAGMVMRSSQRLTINSDRFSTQRKLKMLNPFAQACLKLSRVQTAKDSTKCVVGWNAVGKLQKLLEPLLMSQREPLNIGPRIRPADCAGGFTICREF